MERDPQNEAEKGKKAKKASPDSDKGGEMDHYTDDEGMEEFGEGYEAPTLPSCLPSSPLADSTAETEIEASSEATQDSYMTRRERETRLKWMTVTGRRPLNMPITLTYERGRSEQTTTVVPLGERRPLHVEQQRKENWMKIKTKREMGRSYANEGKLLREVRLVDSYCGLRCLRFSPAADTMVTSFGNGLVQVQIQDFQVWKTDTAEITQSLETVEMLYRLQVMAVRYHPKLNSRVYVGGNAGAIQVFDTESPKCIAMVREKNNEICNLDLCQDGTLLMSVGKDGNVYVYDSNRLRLLSLQRKPAGDEYATPEMELSYHHMRVFGLRCHPTESNIFVTGGWDYTVKVWDTRVCGAVHSIHGPRICGDSIDVRDKEILTGSWTSTNSMKLWDLSSGKLLRDISVKNRSSPINGEFVYIAKFFSGPNHSNCVIVGGNGTDEVAVINIDNNMAVASFPAMKAVTALDSYENIVAYGGMESLMRFGEVRGQVPTVRR